MLSLNLLIGAGAIQGLALACVLFYLANTQKNQPLVWLACFVGAFSLLVLSDVLLQTRAILELPHLYLIFDFLIFWLGPFAYAYVRAMLGYQSWHLRQWQLHLLPGLLIQAFIVPQLWVGTKEKHAIILSDLAITPDHSPNFLVLIAGLLALAYLIASLLLIRSYWRDLESQFSNTDRYKLSWLAQLMAFCSVLWAFWMLSIVWGYLWADLLAQFGLAIGVYSLGYCGLRQPQLWSSLEGNKHKYNQVSNAFVISHATKRQSSPIQLVEESPKYLKSGISPEELASIGGKLNALMQSELAFLEPELSLSELAKRIGISQHSLSQTLNVHFRQSFFEYINALRVQEVQRCFADPAYANQSILEIALASGFSSKATFNATFKRLTGLTPSASRIQLANRQALP